MICSIFPGFVLIFTEIVLYFTAIVHNMTGSVDDNDGVSNEMGYLTIWAVSCFYAIPQVATKCYRDPHEASGATLVYRISQVATVDYISLQEALFSHNRLYN